MSDPYDGREEEYDDTDPCATCLSRDSCDGWEAQFCCTRCLAGMDEIPDGWCDDCNPWDI